MVRLIPVWSRRERRIVWTPDAPDSCRCGFHGALKPGRGCPDCRMQVMVWSCPDCRAVQVDDEHKCRGGPLPASALRGA